MHRIIGALGLIGAIVIGLLAMAQLETLIASMDANAAGGLNTLRVPSTFCSWC